jgi:hypothetical protein
LAKRLGCGINTAHARFRPVLFLVLPVSNAAGGGRIAVELKFRKQKHSKKSRQRPWRLFCAAKIAARDGEEP